MAGVVNSSDDEDYLGYNPNQVVDISDDEGGDDGEQGIVEANPVESSEEEAEEEEDSDEEELPAVGAPMGLPHPAADMEFPCYTAIEQYYTEYALLMGFEFRRQCLRRNRVGVGGPDFLKLECSKGGVYDSKAKNPDYSKRSKKTDCKAMLNARQNIDKPWRITLVNNEHNHPFEEGKTRHMSNHRRITIGDERDMRLHALAGIPFCKSYALMARRKGGIDKMSFSEKDGRNRMNKIRRVELSTGDYEALRYFMDRMMRESPNSYCATDIDDEGRLRNVFWADGRSREAFKDFGDVISFDATYMKNRYRMPFSPFIGVNHHGQSILLGCALITSESTKNYIWVFEQFLICMGGNAPPRIVTDQSPAIGMVF